MLHKVRAFYYQDGSANNIEPDDNMIYQEAYEKGVAELKQIVNPQQQDTKAEEPKQEVKTPETTTTQPAIKQPEPVTNYKEIEDKIREQLYKEIKDKAYKETYARLQSTYDKKMWDLKRQYESKIKELENKLNNINPPSNRQEQIINEQKAEALLREQLSLTPEGRAQLALLDKMKKMEELYDKNMKFIEKWQKERNDKAINTLIDVKANVQEDFDRYAIEFVNKNPDLFVYDENGAVDYYKTEPEVLYEMADYIRNKSLAVQQRQEEILKTIEQIPVYREYIKGDDFLEDMYFRHLAAKYDEVKRPLTAQDYEQVAIALHNWLTNKSKYFSNTVKKEEKINPNTIAQPSPQEEEPNPENFSDERDYWEEVHRRVMKKIK